MFETWVVTEILKSYYHNGIVPPLFFYRDKDVREIDLLIVRDGAITPFEIKKSATPTKEAIRHFECLNRFKVPVNGGGVICLARDSLPLTGSHSIIPVTYV